MPRHLLFAATILLTTLTHSRVSLAEDESITLADDPFEVTDPHATPLGETNLSLIGSYERASRGRVRSTLGAETELSTGVAPNLDFRIGQSGAYGNLDIRRRLGTVAIDPSGAAEEQTRAAFGGTSRVGALYQLMEEQAALPAVGLLGRVRALYGPGRVAYVTEATALCGKTLIGGERPVVISLNLGWIARLNPQPIERANRYLLNASIGKAISRDTALVATYAHEQQERGDRDFQLVQVGVRHRLRDRRATLGFAAGFGLNRDSPQFQLSAAVQWELGSAP